MVKGALFDDGGQANLISPLVDVVMNLMITFFVFLMIYMAVVLPHKSDYVPPDFAAAGGSSRTDATVSRHVQQSGSEFTLF